MKKLTDQILEAGIENCLFLVPMPPVRSIMGISYTSSDDEQHIVPCTIVEDRYKVEKNFKITLQSMYEGFGRDHFYISDLSSLIKSGTVTMYINVSL